MILEGFLETNLAAKKPRRLANMPIRKGMDLCGTRRLRQVEARMDRVFQQIVARLDEEERAQALDRLDVLVSESPDLRVSNISEYPEQVYAVWACLDLEAGPLPGFRDALEQLCRCCVTPRVTRQLRSRLYTASARIADATPDLLPTVALAILSLDEAGPERDSFVQMVVCASAIEWLLEPTAGDGSASRLDVSTWLAADPSDALLSEVGEELAYYYAPIAGVFALLDRSSVLFDRSVLVPYAHSMSQARVPIDSCPLAELVDSRYVTGLRAEIMRVQSILRGSYAPHAIADVEMLTVRALEALDDLPPQVNPLLVAIYVQSWVRYLEVM
jgi:hypothetical protein